MNTKTKIENLNRGRKIIARKIFKAQSEMNFNDPKATRTAFEENCEKEYLEILSGAKLCL